MGVVTVKSLPVRGAWIEMRTNRSALTLGWSLPVRGAWIEISCSAWVNSTRKPSLPVRGAWIEMLDSCLIFDKNLGRSPCGERGLK